MKISPYFQLVREGLKGWRGEKKETSFSPQEGKIAGESRGKGGGEKMEEVVVLLTLLFTEKREYRGRLGKGGEKGRPRL